MSKPSLGRIVHYTLHEGDAERVNRRRDHASLHMRQHQENQTGVIVHVGSDVKAGDVFPLIITRVFPDGLVNGQVFLDGSDTLWVTSVAEGDSEGKWFWPPRASPGPRPARSVW